MAVRFGMKVAEIIGQLTRGFIKATGRNPDGLEKIKIQQEAVQRFKEMNKVLDMEGNVIDTSKGIMGGQQANKFISKNKTMLDDAIDNASPGFANDIKYDAQLVADDLAEKKFNKDFYDLDQKQQMDLYDEAYTGLSKQRFKGMKKPDPEEKAGGGRIGFKGGADMGTVGDSQGNVGARSVDVSPSGDVTTSDDAPDPVDDRGSTEQNFTQYLVNQGYTPKQIRKLKGNTGINPFIKGILRTGLYTINPTLGALDFRKAMQIKELYDYTTDQINNPVSEEDLTLDLITDQQKQIIDKQGKIGQLTGAFDPDQTFEAAKEFDDQGSKGVFGIGAKDPEPMTREEFDNYVEEKGYAQGGRIGLNTGSGLPIDPMDPDNKLNEVLNAFKKLSLGAQNRIGFKNFFEIYARENFAGGGRIGYKIGSIDKARRAFLKTAASVGGGLAALKTGLLGFGKGTVAPTAEKVMEKVATSDVPPYFLNLVNKIKNLGKKFDGPKERSESFVYKDYEMDIDYDTGAIDIKKTKEAMVPGSDEAGISEEVYMTYKPGVADETTKGKKFVSEYEEFTAKPDIDGKMKDVEGGVPDEVIEEGTMFEDNMTEFGKASGGIARMLGE
jgi:hypothetical protein